MSDALDQQLLANVMGWDKPERPELIEQFFPELQLLATYKYDAYQQYSPGRRFMESLALWLQQLDPADRRLALDFVRGRLVFISDAEFFHLVSMAYPHFIEPERMRIVAEEYGFPSHQVGVITSQDRYRELGVKSLYLGLSDGARMSEFRRSCGAALYNDQVWQAYELGDEKGRGLLKALREALHSLPEEDDPRFTLVWLLDDFSASGYSYIRLQEGEFKGKLPRAYDTLYGNELVDPAHYEVFLLFYVATRQALDHIEYWSERFTARMGYKPLQVRAIHQIGAEVALQRSDTEPMRKLIEHDRYYDSAAETKATSVGGTKDVRWGFANCALPISLGHNTPNNSIYLLWGEESHKFFGLFPRVSRYRDM